MTGIDQGVNEAQQRGIHVLHVVPTLGAGGMELAMARVINGLIPAGVSHSILVLKGDPIIRDRIDPAVRIHCLKSGARDPMTIWRMRRIIGRESPTVIHSRNLWAWPEVAMARMTLLSRPPLVFSFHGLTDIRGLPRRWRLMSRILGGVTEKMFTVSEGAKRFLTDQIGLPAERVAVIPNGVDVERFSPASVRRERNEFIVGTVGNLSAVKNQALLVRACHRLIADHGIRLRLEIAGEGPERPALERLIAELGLADRVALRGHVSDTPSFLRNLDVFVLPSDSEAHPNALSEAAATGLPCVATRVGGIPEIVDQGRAALLFERGDEDALVARLAELLNDEAMRERLGNAAREFTVERYSMAAMLASYERMYRELSARGRGS